MSQNDAWILTDGTRIELDRENARVFKRGSELIIIWPQPDGTAWEERRRFANRADLRAGRNPVSTWSKPV